MTPEERAKEIICKWAGTDASSQPLENLIQAVAAALAEKDKELDEARQSFMKAVGDYQGSEFAAITELQSEAAALRQRIAELEAVCRDCTRRILQREQAAHIEGLRTARTIVRRHPWCGVGDDKGDLLDVLDAEIAALERGKE